MAEVIPRKTVRASSCKPESIYRKTAAPANPEQQASDPLESLPTLKSHVQSQQSSTEGQDSKSTAHTVDPNRNEGEHGAT